jgi:membrane protein
VLRGFKANQGLLLAGAVAYYALLSLIPLLLLLLIVLSHVIDQARLLATLTEYVEFIAPGAGSALASNLRTVLASRDVIGVAVTITMVFSSTLAFTVLEGAMVVIFHHRVKVRRRRFIVSALLPYTFILSLGLGLGLLVVTMVAGRLAVLATHYFVWEITRHLLLWYYSSLSRMQEVYGSFTAAVALLLSAEVAAILLLLGAQVIAEYERVVAEPI